MLFYLTAHSALLRVTHGSSRLISKHSIWRSKDDICASGVIKHDSFRLWVESTEISSSYFERWPRWCRWLVPLLLLNSKSSNEPFWKGGSCLVLTFFCGSSDEPCLPRARPWRNVLPFVSKRTNDGSATKAGWGLNTDSLWAAWIQADLHWTTDAAFTWNPADGKLKVILADESR